MVFFDDGARGTDLTLLERKFTTWENKYKRTFSAIEDVEKYCSGHLRIEDLSFLDPYLTQMQVTKVITDLGCKMFQSHGEADVTIANYLNSNSQAFAILGSDSDFCVMKGCRYIWDKWFDLEGDLGFCESTAGTAHSHRDDDELLKHLYVRVVTPEKVLASLSVSINCF